MASLPQRVFSIRSDGVIELDAVPATLPAEGFLWIGLSHAQFESEHAGVQSQLQQLTGAALVDLHVSDLMSQQLPSHFDSTS
jgi:magnesium transporter